MVEMVEETKISIWGKEVSPLLSITWYDKFFSNDVFTKFLDKSNVHFHSYSLTWEDILWEIIR